MKRAIVALLCLALVGIIVFFVTRTVSTPSQEASLISSEALSGLSKKDASGIDTSHLADGMTPPTNKWFSGIALQKEPKTVFPTPMSFAPTDTSFTIDLPTVQTTAKSILAAQTVPTTITINSAAYYRITRYDEVSVDLTYYSSDGAKRAVVTLAAGSPYVFYYGLGASTVEIKGSRTSLAKVNGVSSFRNTNSSSVLYGDAHNGSSFHLSQSTITATIPKDGLLTFYGLPETRDPSVLQQASSARVTSATVNYQRNDTSFNTTIAFSTANNKPTVFGLLPHQKHTASPAFSIDTVYGKQEFAKTSTVTFSTPFINTVESLDLSTLTEEQKTLLATQVRHDSNATQFDAEDTYFAGKQLYRGAQLLQLAHQLDQTEVAQTMQQKLQRELTTWLKPSDGRTKKVFYYDTKMKGIVGETASFGSEAFNDHHFHYGYFIYAASILAKYDTDFKQHYGSIVNLLVADIANTSEGELLPMRRMFDPYFGHSWASGSSPFNDGNNQESISEALNAWVAVSLWASQTGNETLQQEAAWMLSNEHQSALSYWLHYDMSKAPYNQNYTHSISPLNWGGKRDYATFFSTEPSAMLGILLIPMNPTMTSFHSIKERIPLLLEEARANPGPQAQFADYLLMLESLFDQTGSMQSAQNLSDGAIDSANSRSYLYAWILSNSR